MLSSFDRKEGMAMSLAEFYEEMTDQRRPDVRELADLQRLLELLLPQKQPKVFVMSVSSNW